MRYSLSVIAMGVLALGSAQARQVKKPAAPPPAVHVAPAGGDSEIVGTVGGSGVNTTNVTWGEFIANFQKENPGLFKQSVGTYIGTESADALFGASPKSSFTVTKADVLSGLRKHPTTEMGQQLGSMLTIIAVDKESGREGIHVTTDEEDERIKDALKDFRAAGHIPPGVTDDQFFAQQKTTRDKVRQDFKTQVELAKLIQKELEAKQGHAFGPADFVQARHILIDVPEPMPGTTEEAKKKADDDALAKITKISDDIHSGKITFEQAAKDDSADTASKSTGGELGIFTRGMMVPEFENAAFGLKDGEVSKPVRSKFGYHLIQVEKTGSDINPADRKKFLDTYVHDRFRPFLQDLTTKKFKVTNKLAEEAPPPANMQMMQAPQGR